MADETKKNGAKKSRSRSKKAEPETEEEVAADQAPDDAVKEANKKRSRSRKKTEPASDTQEEVAKDQDADDKALEAKEAGEGMTRTAGKKKSSRSKSSKSSRSRSSQKGDADEAEETEKKSKSAKSKSKKSGAKKSGAKKSGAKKSKSKKKDEAPAEEESTHPQTVEELLEATEQMLAGLFEKMQLSIKTKGRVEKTTAHVDLTGEDSKLLLGRGQASPKALESIQTLVRAALTDGRKFSVVLDVGGFRQRRTDRLENVAQRFAGIAEKVGKPVVIAGLNSFERKVVHQALENQKSVKTDSEGYGSFRKLRVEPS